MSSCFQWPQLWCDLQEKRKLIGSRTHWGMTCVLHPSLWGIFLPSSVARPSVADFFIAQHDEPGGGNRKDRRLGFWVIPPAIHSGIPQAHVCVCHVTHCQVPDRFLFVQKLRPVISSIFETIKQWRENGWLGNPWILICQQNENGSGRWYKCAEWEVAADMLMEQTFSFTTPCAERGSTTLQPLHVFTNIPPPPRRTF